MATERSEAHVTPMFTFDEIKASMTWLERLAALKMISWARREIPKMLSGYKTYIVAIGMIAKGIWQLTEGDFQGGFQTIMEGLGFAAVRHGIASL